MQPDTFDRNQLSARENEILSLAADGFTDMHIGDKLNISVSTVSSYWSRIRTKLGSLSRVEMVAAAIRQQAGAEIARMRAENQKLELAAINRSHQIDESKHSGYYRAGLEAIPDAVVIIGSEGTILFANKKLNAMFGYFAEELSGMKVAALFPARHSAEVSDEALGLFDASVELGLDKVIFARRKDGREFRVILLAKSVHSSAGPVCSCLI